MTTETKHAELRECPFCGCDMKAKEDWGYYRPRSVGGHGRECPFRVSELSSFGSVDGLRDKWNTRTSDARIAELEALLRQYDYQLGGETDAVKKRFADLRRDTRAALGEQP